VIIRGRFRQPPVQRVEEELGLAEGLSVGARAK
jgi:hypothetical protein